MKLPGKKTQREKCVLYVDRNSLAFYSKAAQKPCVLNVGPEIVKDMEVVSPEQLVQALSYWMDSNKILACDVVIVLSETVYFEHAVQSLAGEESDKEIEMYLDTVPFEQSVSRIIVDDASKRAVVLSRDYYDLLLEFLEKRYFRVLALFPASLLNIKSPEEIKVDSLIKNLDDYKKYNFLSDFERHFVPESFTARPKDTKNLKIMAAVFGLLIVVLAVVIYFGLIKKS
jgi:hypothetical protein